MWQDDICFGQSVGKKFNSDGSARVFKGNTMICLLDHDTEVFRRVVAERDLISSAFPVDVFSPLPDESLHMTAIEGVCNDVREKDYWTSLLTTDTPLVEVDDLFEDLWKKVPPFPSVKMRFDNLWISSGICIGLYPDSYSDDVLIRDWRDAVSSVMGLRFPGHDRYRFHISLGYGISMPDKEGMEKLDSFKKDFDEKCRKEGFVFTVPPASMTYFDSMLFFSKERLPR